MSVETCSRGHFDGFPGTGMVGWAEEEVMQMLGARLAALRRQKGWSQGELAKKLSISPSAIGMYEQGRREPSAQTLAALAQIYGVSMEYLVTGRPRESEYRGLQEMVESRILSAQTHMEHRPEPPLSREQITALFAALLLE